MSAAVAARAVVAPHAAAALGAVAATGIAAVVVTVSSPFSPEAVVSREPSTLEFQGGF